MPMDFFECGILCQSLLNEIRNRSKKPSLETYIETCNKTPYIETIMRFLSPKCQICLKVASLRMRLYLYINSHFN